MKAAWTGLVALIATGLALAPAAVAQAAPDTMASATASAATRPAIPAGYLAGQPPIDLLKLLPPPPAMGSAQAEADLTAYRPAAAGIGGPAWTKAVGQLNPASPAFFQQLSCALGRQLSREATPTAFVMIARAGVDFAGPMTVLKNHYARPRPFSIDKGKACDPITADGKGEKLGWAYPSGHAGIGWLWALILSDAAPGRAEALRAFGQETGDLRIACRVHWLSDVAYGRMLGGVLYKNISATPQYQADVIEAAAELAKLPPLEDPACL